MCHYSSIILLSCRLTSQGGCIKRSCNFIQFMSFYYFLTRLFLPSQIENAGFIINYKQSIISIGSMSDHGSINFGGDESLHIEAPPRNNFSNFNSQMSRMVKVNEASPLKYINVISGNKISRKILLCGQFQQFLNNDSTSSGVVPVCFLGAKRLGKSFLLDNLLNLETQQTRRVMCRNRQQILNCANYMPTIQTGQKMMYLDYNGEPTPPIFSLLYYISSVMVYNLSPSNENEQIALFECLSPLLKNEKMQANKVSKPKLIIVRRDTGSKQTFDFDLLRRIEQLQLFQPQVSIIHLPYPGNPNINAKQLLDVPKNQLSPYFLNQVTKLKNIIRTSASTKYISTQKMNPQTLNLAIQYLIRSVNNQQPINTNKIMNSIYEDLSVGYYNKYLKLYSEELEREFAEEDPYDKYTLYKKLSKIKRKVSKRMDKFSLNNDDPVFRRYLEKLQETVRNKEQLVRNTNQVKSRQFHQKNLEGLTQNLNKQNFEEVIDRYCKSKLDDQKTEVLLQNWQRLLRKSQQPNQIPIKVSKPRTMQPPPQLASINKEIEQLERMIMLKSKTVQKSPQNYETIRTSIEKKKTMLNSLKQQYERLQNQNANRFVSSQNPKSQYNQEFSQLQQEKEKLNTEIQKYNKDIQNLQKVKESKFKETAARIQQQLRREQQNLRMLRASNLNTAPMPYQSKVIAAGKSTKKTCCMIM